MPDATNQPSSLPVSALEYELPEDLIATRPAEPRDSARLLVVRCSSDAIEHATVRDLPGYLDADDVLVFNNTAVAPARLVGHRAESGGRVEGLFLEAHDERTWRVMLRSNGRLHVGDRIVLENQHEVTGGIDITLLEKDGAEWLVQVARSGTVDDALDDVGRTPLPPYILRARKSGHIEIDDDRDRRWYQTIYADPARRKSVAAPTAGLHFTPELMDKIDARGVQRLDVTLHVGPGTFKPITAETIDGHDMHSEWYEVPAPTLGALRDAHAASRRVIAVGTTSVRTLESLPEPLPGGGAIVGETDLLIAPRYAFKHISGMITNFHLPRSTLLALVGAMVGLERLLTVYREAVQREYRFYSYGDAMLILP